LVFSCDDGFVRAFTGCSSHRDTARAEKACQALTMPHNNPQEVPVMANTGRNFSLTDRQQRFVSAQVANGRHASGSEVIREALRRYEDDILREQARVAALNRLAEEGEAAHARGDYTLLSGRDALRAFIRKTGARAVSRDQENAA
jgi:antitoxin ParD1/3/4